MKSPLVQDTANSAKSIAQTIAKQVAAEPLEILKNAGAQVTGAESSSQRDNLAPGQPDGESTRRQDGQASKQQELKDKAFTQRRMQALQNEVDEIRKQGIFKDLQAKISAGESVALEDYPELSMEQKQVLKAQIEAVSFQQKQAQYQASIQEVPTIRSKPSRRFGAGQKHEAEKAQTRVEKPIPPSG